jgi:hypothetical protein
MKHKLNFTQYRLLRAILERPQYVSDFCKPAVKLINLGLAEFHGSILHATEKGRVALDK